MPRRPQATYSPPPSASTRSGSRWAAPGLQLCAVHSWAATSLFFSRFSYTHSRSSAQKSQPACLTSCPRPISTPVTYTADLVPCTQNLDYRDWDMNEPRRPDDWPSPRPAPLPVCISISHAMSCHAIAPPQASARMSARAAVCHSTGASRGSRAKCRPAADTLGDGRFGPLLRVPGNPPAGWAEHGVRCPVPLLHGASLTPRMCGAAARASPGFRRSLVPTLPPQLHAVTLHAPHLHTQ